MIRPSILALIAGLSCACSAGGMTGFRDTGPSDAHATDSFACMPGQMTCVANASAVCGADGQPGLTHACGTMTCVDGFGCVACAPSTTTCDASGNMETCAHDGSGYTTTVCPSGQHCSSGACVDLCVQAMSNHSYIGCDYWPVALLNSELGSIPSDPTGEDPSGVGVDGFPYALAVGNPQSFPANVTITGGALTASMAQTIMPGALQVIQLPWVQSTSQVNQAGQVWRQPGASVFATHAAYHLTSDAPVTVYQFNALSYEDVRRTGCDPSDPTDEACFSYSNDSSLLLPTPVLTGNYLAVTRPSFTIYTDLTMQYSSSGGFVTIVGTQAGTTVTVTLTGAVRAGTGVTHHAAGSTITQTLGAGDVLELVSDAVSTAAQCNMETTPISSQPDGFGSENLYACRPNAQFDLTGTSITASAPVAVYGGHDCTFVPFDRFACDHLEQQLFPNETLGTHYFASRTAPQLPGGEPNVLRITSNADANAITFSPDTDAMSTTLDRGQYVEFEQHQHVEINGTGPFAVTQFLVGESYFGNDMALPPDTVGDPSMSLEVPVEQWRTSYQFLAPDTYPVTYVNVVANHGSQIMMDGTPLTAAPTTAGSFDVYQQDISTHTGAHTIESSDGTPFAIKVYGFGSYTSYMYPGGLDLMQISPG